jgi:hypothetical protein
MNSSLVMRPMRPAEAATVRRLAYLDSSRPLRGDVLVALVDDCPVAAVSLSDGRVVADPFERTADVVELLREHAAGVRDGRTEAHRRRRSPRRPRLGLAY